MNEVSVGGTKGQGLLLGGIACAFAVTAALFRWMDNLLGLPGGAESRLFLLLLVGVAFGLVVQAMANRNRVGLSLPIEVLLMVAWLGWCWAWGDKESAFWGKGFWSALRNAGLSVASMGVIASIVGSVEKPRMPLIGLALAAVGLCAFGLLEGSAAFSFSEWQWYEYRMGSNMGNSNDLGYHLLLGLIWPAWVVIKGRSWWARGVAMAVAVLLVGGIVLTGSRKAFLGAIFLLAFGYLMVHRLRAVMGFRLVSTALGAGVLFIGVEYVVDNTFMGERLKRAQTIEELEERETSRIDKYHEMVEILRENPTSGIGLGCFHLVSRSHQAPHSEYVAVLAETGVGGGILYFGVYVLIWLKLGRARRRWRMMTDIWARQMRPWGDLAAFARFLQAVIVMLVLIGLGRSNWAAPAHFVVLGTMVGFVNFWDRGSRVVVSRECNSHEIKGAGRVGAIRL